MWEELTDEYRPALLSPHLLRALPESIDFGRKLSQWDHRRLGSWEGHFEPQFGSVGYAPGSWHPLVRESDIQVQDLGHYLFTNTHLFLYHLDAVLLRELLNCGLGFFKVAHCIW